MVQDQDSKAIDSSQNQVQSQPPTALQVSSPSMFENLWMLEDDENDVESLESFTDPEVAL